MKNRFLICLLAAPAIGIGLYPILYFFIDMNSGLLNTKEAWLLESTIWNIGFYTHIIFGGIALLIGWIQFVDKWRIANIIMHRNLGKIYLSCVLLSSLSGIYLGVYASGGIIPSAGFVSLGILWFLTSYFGYVSIIKNRLIAHKNWMIYSYSLCFAAVTLRIWLPLLSAFCGEFLIAYQITAWLCWVPNLIVAYFIIKKEKPKELSSYSLTKMNSNTKTSH